MSTIAEKQAEIVELQGKNNNANIVWGSVSLLGSIGGVVVAHKMGYKFWGKVGFFFLGGMVTGLPMRLIYANKISERQARINLLKDQIWDENSKLNKEQLLQKVNNSNASYGLASKEDALDLIKSAKKADEKRQSLAPSGIGVSKNWLTNLDTNPTYKDLYVKSFLDQKVSKGEYNAVSKFLNSFEKNETETIKKMTQDEVNLFRSFDAKLTPFKKTLS